MVHPAFQPAFVPVRGGRQLRCLVAIVTMACLAPIAVRADDSLGILVSGAAPELWQRTTATVGAEWPIARLVEPDFTIGSAGLIESAWVEPSGQMAPTWPPTRQRAIVRLTPDTEGAWLDAYVQTQTLSGAAAGGRGIELVGVWETSAATADMSVELA